MHMIGLHVERAYRPGIGFTNAADFPVKKRCQFPNENLLPIFRTPDKMVAELVRDMLGMLCIHAYHCNKCSTSCEVPVGTALPLDES